MGNKNGANERRFRQVGGHSRVVNILRRGVGEQEWVSLSTF
jgi:hypothetical protein